MKVKLLKLIRSEFTLSHNGHYPFAYWKKHRNNINHPRNELVGNWFLWLKQWREVLDIGDKYFNKIKQTRIKRNKYVGR